MRLDSLKYDHTMPGIVLAYNDVALMELLRMDTMVGTLLGTRLGLLLMAAAHNQIVVAR